MFIIIDPMSSTPLYQQIVDEIRAKILSGELQSNDPLPSIRQLASDLLTSVITVKRAYQELEGTGLIQTRHGRGTFVTSLPGKSMDELKLAEVKEKMQEMVRNANRVGLTRRTMVELLQQVMDEEGLN